jgi:Na+/melibiose symporter-like transporter
LTGFAAVLKLVVWGLFVAIALQVIFYFVFQVIGYDLFLLSILLTISVVLLLVVIIAWRKISKKWRFHCNLSIKPSSEIECIHKT